ncbi:MAG: hypothetical protein E7049_06095 [Lentisphaerae bacterium]|nr:hypothetical protein [Lentisphaerota bacterium]
MKIQHFVLTRFNLRLSWLMRGREWLGGTQEYLDERFRLFERYCLPSMSKQDADFRWLVFFSSQTPETFKERVRLHQSSFPALEPIFVDDCEPLSKPRSIDIVMNEVLGRIDLDTTHYIETRIDNDDAFNVQALKWIRDCAEQSIAGGVGEKFYVMLPDGNIYIERASFAQRCRFKWNHFPSMVCRRDVHDHPFAIPHTAINSSGCKVVEINHPNAWLEVVHGSNQLNSLRPSKKPIYLSNQLMRTCFGIEADMSPLRFAFSWLSMYLPSRIRFLVDRMSERNNPRK